MNSRRVAAIYLPQLPCELATHVKRPDVKVSLSQLSFGVVLIDPHQPTDKRQCLMSVTEAARRQGVFEGQTLEEARAIHAAFVVRELPQAALMLGLERVIDSLRDFDLTVACEPPHTVWLDITGAAHLLGGEPALAQELVERMRLLGHSARVAIASGPRLAQVFARAATLGQPQTRVIAPEQTQAQLDPLPTLALPLDRNAITWLTRLGVITLGELRNLPRTELLARLGSQAECWIELAHGIDHEPLTLYPPTPTLTESFDWEEPTHSLQALTFALRRLTVRLEARLRGRGSAAERVQVSVKHDGPTARHRGVPLVTEFSLKLPVPLWHEDELRKVIVTRLERTTLPAPCVGLQLCVTHLAAAVGKQLELSRIAAGFSGKGAPGDARGLDVLLSELATEVSGNQMGVFSLVDSFLPEKQGCLVGLTPTAAIRGSRIALSRKAESRPHRGRTLPKQPPEADPQVQTVPLRKTRGRARIPTRIFACPLPIASANDAEFQHPLPLKIGATIILNREMYVVERVRFDHRLSNVEWWNEHPVSRDYLWLSLAGALGKLEAFAYVDRSTGQFFVQGLRD